jgi:hypothetical protein
MQSVGKEIINFIESISLKEIRTNTNLRREIKALLKRITLTGKTITKQPNGVLDYIDRDMLNSK